MGLRLAKVLGVSLLLSSAPAAAEDGASRTVAIEWRAPPECPNESSLRDGVQRLFGGAIPPTELSVRAELSEAPPRYALVLETTAQGQHGVKRLEDVSCEELTRAAAVLIALAIDPDLPLSEEEGVALTRTPDAPAPDGLSPVAAPPLPAATNGARDAPHASGAPTPAHASASASASASALAVDGTLAAGGEVGTVPGFSPGLLVQGDARFGVMLVGVGGQYLAPQTARVPGRPELGALIGYVGGEAFGCVGAFARRAAPAACAGVAVGRLKGESRGAPVPGRGSLLWVTPELGGTLRYGLGGPVRIEGGIFLRFAVQDSEFTLDNVGHVYSPATVAVRIHIGGVFQIF